MKNVIITNRCTLYPLDTSDEQSFIDLYLNAQAREFLGGISIPQNSLMRLKEMLDDSDALHWSVRLKDDNSFVGVINIDKHRDSNEYEVSYQFMPNHWGKGLAHETVLAAIENSLPMLSKKTILAETQTQNKKSIALLIKLGFKEIDQIIRFGEMQSIYEYRI